MKCPTLFVIAILLVMPVLCPTSCNAEWIDRDGRIVEPPGRQLTGPDISEGLVRFGVYGSATSSHLRDGAQGKFGFKDPKGNIVIPAKFSEAGTFHEGLAPVFCNKKWSYINQAGKEAIKLPNACTYAGDFSEGLAAIVLRDKAKSDDRLPRRGVRLGYINTSGKLAIPAKFRFTFAKNSIFSDGLAAVVPGDQVLLNYGYINHDGQWVIMPKYLRAMPSRSGKAEVTLGPQVFSSWGGVRKKTNSEEPPSGIDRERQFQLFLASHDLLGMPLASLEQFLGPADYKTVHGQGYWLDTSCTTALGVELVVSDGVVSKYRYQDGDKFGQWIDQSHPDYSEMSHGSI